MQGYCYGLEDLRTIVVQPHNNYGSVLRLQLPNSVNIKNFKTIFQASAQKPVDVVFRLGERDCYNGKFNAEIMQ